MREKRKYILFGVVQSIVLFIIAVLAINIGIWFLGGSMDIETRKVVPPKKEPLAEETAEKEHAEVMANAGTLVRCGSGELVEDYAAYCGLDEVERPVKRKPHEIRKKLEEQAEEDARIAEVCGDLEPYPENMLEALANNPEMADFVLGYRNDRELAEDETGNADMAGAIRPKAELTGMEKEQEYPLFLQWDPRWGYLSYGDDSNVGLAGCGPTSLSMALYYLTKDASLTPDKIASYAMENDYYMYGTGTLWALIEDVPGQYGVGVKKPGLTETAMKQEVDNGNVLICAMRPGDFTAVGHFIVICDYDEDGFLIRDPNCVARSRRAWRYEELSGQIKQMWSLGK